MRAQNDRAIVPRAPVCATYVRHNARVENEKDRPWRGKGEGGSTQLDRENSSVYDAFQYARFSEKCSDF